LDSNYFPQDDIQNSIGSVFNILMVDKYGDSTTTNPVTLRRIIDLVLQSRYPSQNWGYGTVSSGIVTFKWAPLDSMVYFDFHYRFKLFYYLSGALRNDMILEENSPGLVFDSLVTRYYFYTIPNDSLADNSYYWTMQLEDIYGNFTRSEINQFEVDAGQ
jgi:hypothetical protein